MSRYVGVNCSKCGRFVGKDGFMDEHCDEYNGSALELGYPLCARCLKYGHDKLVKKVVQYIADAGNRKVYVSEIAEALVIDFDLIEEVMEELSARPL